MSLTKVSYTMIKGAPINVLDYGAVGNGIADDTLAIQKAIDAAYTAGGGIVVIPSGYTFLVTQQTYSGMTGAGSVILKDNITLQLDGTIKLKDNNIGGSAYYAVIRTLDVGGSNIRITGRGTVDGNKANQVPSTQCSNIMLKYVTSNIVVECINSINANGIGIQVVGVNPAAGSIGGADNVRISDTTVYNCAYIGIQCAQFNNLRIENNYVNFTGDNAIDIYGENSGSTVASGTNFVVDGNVCRNCLTGVFAETVALGVISNNVISLTQVGAGGAGIHVNRINGLPYGVNVTGNTISDSETGIWVTGDMNGVLLNNNSITSFSIAGIKLGQSGGNVSYVDVSSNFFTPPNTTTANIAIVGTQAAFVTGRFNTVNVSGASASYLAVNSATTSVNVNIDSFRTLPNQVGSDLNAILPQFGVVSLLYGNQDNIAGPYDISVPDATGGTLYLTAYQGGVGRSTWIVPYTKYGTDLALGTPQKSFITADPIVSVTSVSGAARVTLLAANSYIKWGFTYTSVS